MQTLLLQREAACSRENDQLLDLKAVCEFFGRVDRSTIYRGIAAQRYPAPIKVGPNTSRWLRSECEAALQTMIQRRAGQ